MANKPFRPEQDNLDPVFVHARREACIVLVVWIIGLAWTVGYCLATGYDVPPEQIQATLGVPNWIFRGVLVPWILVILFTIWFGLFYIANDELGQEQGESDRGPSHNSPQDETDEVPQ